jgi:dienelactone hydrolase
VTSSAGAETWFLDHGYALAASNFTTPIGYHVDAGYQDQIRLLAWFDSHVGRPRRVISTGQSLGDAITVRLGERRPDLVDGVATFCAALDPEASFNAGLDISFVVKTLLAPGQDIDLVHPRDPEASTAALQQAVDEAVTTSQGRARLALAAAMNNVTGWWSALQPRPTDPDEVIRQQALWLRNAYIGGFGGPIAHADLEAKVGGNPAFNIGVDYRRQLARSSQSQAVKDAYRRAGQDLNADLATLDAAPRIAADPAALAHMYRTAIPTGRTRVPVITLHSVGDGGAVPDQDSWYNRQVRHRSGPNMVRSLFVDRGQHCSYSAADEVVTVQSLEHRLDTGRWPDLRPAALNAHVASFDTTYQQVLDLSSFPFQQQVMPPAFTAFRPPALLRPSR